MPKPPINGMSVEEIKARVRDGIANRRKQGQLRPAAVKNIKTVVDGPSMNKHQRKIMIQAASLAIYSLANGDSEDYCGACDVMNAIRRQAGYGTDLLQEMLKDVAEQAAHCSGEDFQVLDHLARRWLVEHYTPSNKVISIVRGKTNGNAKKQT